MKNTTFILVVFIACIFLFFSCEQPEEKESNLEMPGSENTNKPTSSDENKDNGDETPIVVLPEDSQFLGNWFGSLLTFDSYRIEITNANWHLFVNGSWTNGWVKNVINGTFVLTSDTIILNSNEKEFGIVMIEDEQLTLYYNNEYAHNPYIFIKNPDFIDPIERGVYGN